MAGFSPRDAALEGFRLTREHPGAVVGLFVLQFIMLLTLTWLVVQSGALKELAALYAVAQPGSGAAPVQPDPAAAQAMYQKLTNAIALATPLMLILGAVAETAVVRLVLDPGRQSLGAVRLGMDEVRVLAVRLAIAVMGMVLQIVAKILATAVGGVAGLANLIVVLLLAGLMIVAVRFSMAIPMTFSNKRISIIQSLSLTKGLSLPIFGAYLLAFLLSGVVTLLGVMISIVVLTLAGGAAPLFNSTSPMALLHPGVIALVAVASLFQALATIIMTAPSAWIYRSLQGRLV